jgi:hypothetical protein
LDTKSVNEKREIAWRIFGHEGGDLPRS